MYACTDVEREIRNLVSSEWGLLYNSVFSRRAVNAFSHPTSRFMSCLLIRLRRTWRMSSVCQWVAPKGARPNPLHPAPLFKR